ncbi:alpha/beta fold hydrolase [Bifidobacterium vespertilionis]|uniref:Alpha/beta fold hydrolase n=1 Tax=Bifidobacterium vespertilionis TaxID=2562524 RepID=A0A5J5E6K1_9BIFI|nr:alpha/beta fold hydrolase [Bifidobacterium vespertilionis]KAA8821715.1 alpha/beta fold hydrolase [Bifidobacterium vespertilionis]KAA8824795.1 alpha/beta fold hydrolase [Bifidobacterium vespertilionis]
MTLLAQYYVPGLHVEDHAIDVPLDWTGKQPGEAFDGESLRLFYRVVTSPEHVHDDLPLLIYLQGGPGGESPRPWGPTSDGWMEEALKHFRIVLPDQRGTGRSNHVDGIVMRRIGDPQAQAAYLKHFLADSIVKDFEHLRRTVFCGRQWVTLGQSYGGFLTLTYLSFFPEGVIASFTGGGIPHVPANATEVYQHTFPRMVKKTTQFYERYPQDVERAAAVADILANNEVILPGGDQLTVERFQMLGSDFGMKPSFERVHWILDSAFLDGDGSASKDSPLSEEFLSRVEVATSSRPLYWPLQEFIYCDGEMDEPIRWAAQRVRDTKPEFAPDARPLMFTGEAMFPWMFDKEKALRPFKPAMDILMEDTSWGRIYDEDQLARNEVPLQAGVYFDDLYVDSGMQLDTLSRVGNSHYLTTNEFEHDGLHGAVMFKRLYNEALNRGDLESLF